MAQENKAQASEIRYLNPVSVDVKKKKYCRFKKLGIKYVDYITQKLPWIRVSLGILVIICSFAG